jgi:hypothetical protein
MLSWFLDFKIELNIDVLANETNREKLNKLLLSQTVLKNIYRYLLDSKGYDVNV